MSENTTRYGDIYPKSDLFNKAAVGAYNAGFRKTEEQAQRRYVYARKIEATYRAIKKNKNAEQFLPKQ